MKNNVVDLGELTEGTVRNWPEKYEKKEDDYYCKQCGSKIKQTTVYVSIHLKIFDPSHAGPGKVIHINYPYCPKCDGKIDYAQACYHVDFMRQATVVVDVGNLLLNPGKSD